MNTLKNGTIEWAPFTIKDGITAEQLKKASEDLQEYFLVKQKGFIKRELLQKSPNEYIDLVYWENSTAAKNAVVNAEKSPACYAYFNIMEDAEQTSPGDGITYFKVIEEYKS